MNAVSQNRQCVICGQICPPGTYHFCSSRCADIDLARWLGEDYRLKVKQSEVIREPDEDDTLQTSWEVKEDE